MDRILCYLSIVRNCAIFAPPRFVRDRCALDFDKIQKVPSDLAMRPVQLQGHRMAEIETTFPYTPFGDGISKGPPPSENYYGVDGNLLFDTL